MGEMNGGKVLRKGMIWAYWVSAVLGEQITEIKVLGLRLEGEKPLRDCFADLGEQ